jgi:hypothetical protein
MKRIHIYAAAIAMALVPAVLGLWGNASFSQNVPVRVPSSVLTTHPSGTSSSGTAHDANDDNIGKGGHDHDRPATPGAAPHGSLPPRGDDHHLDGRQGSEPERGDDHGGDRRQVGVERGHDSDGDDVRAHEGGAQLDGGHGRGHGSDDHGVDDHGVDDIGRGSGGHGSDD